MPLAVYTLKYANNGIIHRYYAEKSVNLYADTTTQTGDRSHIIRITQYTTTKHNTQKCVCPN